MLTNDAYGYLFCHFVESSNGDGEQVFFSLSDGDTPLRWTRLNAGAPVLRSNLGTTGVRDPFIVRGRGEFFLMATDLRVVDGDGLGWDGWVRRGSRSIVVWRSTNLIDWSDPWLADLAPPTAGMAWAPEATYDDEADEFLVYWSSNLYDVDDTEHAASSYSRVLSARTRDFRTFSKPIVMIDRGHSVIDTTAVRVGSRLHRFSKEDSRALESQWVYQEVGTAIDGNDFETITSRIGADRGEVEAPLIIQDHDTGRWYLWVDQYTVEPTGYIAFEADDIASGDWKAVDASEFSLPSHSKHGTVITLRGTEWSRLRETYPPTTSPA